MLESDYIMDKLDRMDNLLLTLSKDPEKRGTPKHKFLLDYQLQLMSDLRRCDYED